MGKVKFILKEPKAKENTLIYLIFNYQYKRFKYSTGERINPKNWNPTLQRVKSSRQFPQYPEFNARLDKLESGFNNAFRKLLNDGIQPNNTILKKALEHEISDNIVKPNRVTLLSFIEAYIQESVLNKKNSTIKVYKTVFSYLKQYSKKYHALDFDSITVEFYNHYLGYLKREYNLSSNTIGKHIKTLKAFMNEATERGLNTNLEFKNKRFKTIREDSDKVYLSIEELKKIEDLDFSKNPKLDEARDLFLTGCYTGLRFSDFSQINPENINQNQTVINIRTVKTGQKVSIPLHKTVRNILKKYNNELPKSKTNKSMNIYIKEIVHKARIIEKIETTITKGGVVDRVVLPKYQLISTHTARRSFATNLFLAEVPTISIMKITGHKTERSFMQYIRMSQRENADKLLTHPFFK